MLTFDEAREIAAQHYGEPFAHDGLEDDESCLLTPQRVVDDEARGLVMVGGAWIVVGRATGEIDQCPHLDHLERVQRVQQKGSAADET